MRRLLIWICPPTRLSLPETLRYWEAYRDNLDRLCGHAGDRGVPVVLCTLPGNLLAAPFDQGTLYPSPDLILNFTVDGNGELFIPLPTANDPLLCGLPVYWQVMVTDDPGATGFRQTSQTNYVVSVGGT